MVTATPTSPAATVIENRAGRPSDFTQKKRTAILEAIKLGMPEGRAAELCGLDPSTLAHWKARGRREESGPYTDFLMDLKEADAHCERALLATVQKAAQDPKHWTAAMTLLERKYPKRWGKLDRILAGGLSPLQNLERSIQGQWVSEVFEAIFIPDAFKRRGKPVPELSEPVKQLLFQIQEQLDQESLQ